MKSATFQIVYIKENCNFEQQEHAILSKMSFFMSISSGIHSKIKSASFTVSSSLLIHSTAP